MPRPTATGPWSSSTTATRTRRSAERFAGETDPRIRYLRNETNLGITENYARCRELASAELMMFLGCDDLLDPDFVAHVRAAHAAFPDAAVIQVGVRVIDEHGAVVDPLGDRVKRAIRPGRPTGPSSAASRWRSACSAATGSTGPPWCSAPSACSGYPFRDGLPIIQDLALVIDMVAAGETLVLDPAVCFSYRRHTESASSTSLLHGRRLPDERRYYAEAAAQMQAHGLAAGGPHGPAAVDQPAARADPAARRRARAARASAGCSTHAFRP